MDLFKSVAHYLKNTDLYLAVIAFICSGYGMALIYSATLNPVSIKDDGSTKNLYVQGAAILIGFTDEGDHTCLIAKGELNRVDMLYCFSKGIQNLFERMDALKQDGGVQ